MQLHLYLKFESKSKSNLLQLPSWSQLLVLTTLIRCLQTLLPEKQATARKTRITSLETVIPDKQIELVFHYLFAFSLEAIFRWINSYSHPTWSMAHSWPRVRKKGSWRRGRRKAGSRWSTPESLTTWCCEHAFLCVEVGDESTILQPPGGRGGGGVGVYQLGSSRCTEGKKPLAFIKSL